MLTGSFLLQTEGEHNRYLQFRSVHRDRSVQALQCWAPSFSACKSLLGGRLTNNCLTKTCNNDLAASNVPRQGRHQSDCLDTETNTCSRAIEDSVVIMDRQQLPSRCADRFECRSVVVDDETLKERPVLTLGLGNTMTACGCSIPSCEDTLIQQDHASYNEQIMRRVFIRRALSAGDEMDHRVDGIRDAICQSDSSSAWFTRYCCQRVYSCR